MELTFARLRGVNFVTGINASVEVCRGLSSTRISCRLGKETKRFFMA